MTTPVPQTQTTADESLLPRLLKVAQHLSEQKDVPRLLDALLREACYLCGADAGVAWLYDDAREGEGLRCLCRAPGAAQPIFSGAVHWWSIAPRRGPTGPARPDPRPGRNPGPRSRLPPSNRR